MKPTSDIQPPQSLSRFRQRFSVAVLCLSMALLAVPAARADFPFPPTPREVHHEVHAVVHDVLRTLGRVPAEIHRDHVRHLQTFFRSNAYYGPHRHYHATYSFPVWVSGEVFYRPYVYCNGHLYGSYASRAQFWSGWGVAAQGRWCGHHHAYYPTRHACFRPLQHAPYPSHYGSYQGSSPKTHHGHGGGHSRDRNGHPNKGHSNNENHRH